MASRFTALREQSVAYRLKALERVATTATTAGIHHFEGLSTATGGKDNDHTALWLALRCETDPLGVAEGSRVDVSMDLSLISPKSGGTQYVDIGIVGAQLIVDARISSGQRQVVQGTLRGAAIIVGLVGTLANAQRALQFSVPVLISSEPSDRGRNTRVEVDFSALLFDNRGFLGIDRLGVRVGTADQGQLAEVQISLSARDVATELGAVMRRNDQVLRLGNPLRAASEAAIDVIATRESATNFATQARADLFGERPPQQDALSIRASLDWVLFHRRRNKQCGAAPTAPVLEQRRYELHHLKVTTEAQLRTARAAVLAANAASIRRLGFAPVGAAAFDGGRSSLATPTAELLQDWQAAQPGSRIRFGAIGSQGAAQAEGEALAQARLSGLELTLAQGQLERALENQVLPVLPALGLAGWDGAIFLITQQVQLICHDVIALDNEEALKGFAALVKRAGLKAAMDQLGLQFMAHVDYQDDGQNVEPASAMALRAAWGDGGAPANLALVYHGSSTTANVAEQRTTALLKALGGAGDKVQAFVAADLDQVSACAGVSVIVRPPPAQVLTHQVLLGFSIWRSGSFFPNSDTASISRHEFKNLKPAEAENFAKAFETLLGRQPDGLTVATQTTAEAANALGIKKTGDELVAQFNYKDIKVSNTQVLGEPEIKAIEAMGFARTTWQFVVFLNTRV